MAQLYLSEKELGFDFSQQQLEAVKQGFLNYLKVREKPRMVIPNPNDPACFGYIAGTMGDIGRNPNSYIVTGTEPGKGFYEIAQKIKADEKIPDTEKSKQVTRHMLGVLKNACPEISPRALFNFACNAYQSSALFIPFNFVMEKAQQAARKTVQLLDFSTIDQNLLEFTGLNYKAIDTFSAAVKAGELDISTLGQDQDRRFELLYFGANGHIYLIVDCSINHLLLGSNRIAFKDKDTQFFRLRSVICFTSHSVEFLSVQFLGLHPLVQPFLQQLFDFSAPQPIAEPVAIINTDIIPFENKWFDDYQPVWPQDFFKLSDIDIDEFMNSFLVLSPTTGVLASSDLLTHMRLYLSDKGQARRWSYQLLFGTEFQLGVTAAAKPLYVKYRDQRDPVAAMAVLRLYLLAVQQNSQEFAKAKKGAQVKDKVGNVTRKETFIRLLLTWLAERLGILKTDMLKTVAIGDTNLPLIAKKYIVELLDQVLINLTYFIDVKEPNFYQGRGKALVDVDKELAAMVKLEHQRVLLHKKSAMDDGKTAGFKQIHNTCSQVLPPANTGRYGFGNTGSFWPAPAVTSGQPEVGPSTLPGFNHGRHAEEQN